MKQEIIVERLSTNDNEMELLYWYVEDGEYIEAGQPLADLESSKAAVEIVSDYSGYVKRNGKVGDTVKVGSVLATISSEVSTPNARVETDPSTKPEIKNYDLMRFSRSAEEYIQKNNIDTSLFDGAGLVTTQTIIHHFEEKSDSEKTENLKEVQLSNAKKYEINLLKSGQAEGLKSSLTLEFESANIRKGLSKLGLPSNQILPIILYELSRLLEKYSVFNAFYDENKVVYYDEVNIGLAMDMGKGLKVPVIHHANNKSHEELFEETVHFVTTYLENKLSLNDLTGGTFTVSDLSNDRVLHFQPLINQHQAAILGIGGDSEKEGFPITLTLVFDHRILSGRDVAEFLNSLRERLLGYAVDEVVVEEENEIGNVIPSISVEDESQFVCHNAGLNDEFSTDIAIIGMSGRFPGANNIHEFWENLKNGKESIKFLSDEELKAAGVPLRDIQDPEYVKAQPIIEDADCFDAQFFKCSPREAELMDPQQRLILECAWKAIEDAGYAPDGIEVPTGVYLSVFWNMYQYVDMWLPKLLPDMSPSENFQSIVSNDKDFIATRVSYKLNLKGPSLCVQTACSSSLVGVHLATQSLLAGECDMALAGGSSLIPQNTGYKYQKNLIFSPDGHCRAFDADANGTIFGNGVGIIVLKRLSDALRDKDHIYAVIKGTAINNDGATKADFTSPSVQGQQDVIVQALEMAQVNPETIGYVEAHGTGTKIGDPLELSALTQAYDQYTDKKGFCSIGSVKPNIGHLNSIAGMPSLVKVALSLKNGVIPPVINYNRPNPEIDFENSPFYVNTTLQDWERGWYPRRAGVSSFGIGGTNAHAILEEAPEHPYNEEMDGEPYHLMVLSAKTNDSLNCMLDEFETWLKNNEGNYRLSDISYTLAIGRSKFNHRLAIVANSYRDLIHKIESYRSSGKVEDFLANDLKQNPCQNDLCLQELGESLLMRLKNGFTLSDQEYKRKVLALGDLFIKGYSFDWNMLFEDKAHYRIPLPTYSFARDKYWIPSKAVREKGSGRVYQQGLHPLIDSNHSTFEAVSFNKRFSKEEFFLRDHVVGDRNILPGVAYLEMVRAAGSLASPKEKVKGISNIVWVSPLEVGEKGKNIRVHLKKSNGDIRFEVVGYSESGNRLVHSQGMYYYGKPDTHKERIDITEVKKRMTDTKAPENLYSHFSSIGLHYGTTFKAIHELYFKNDESLSKLVLSNEIRNGEEFFLHPSIMDGAVQTFAAIYMEEQNRKLFLPMSLKKLELFHPLTSICYAHTQFIESKNKDIVKFNIRIYDESGILLVKMDEFVARVVKEGDAGQTTEYIPPTYEDKIYFKPVWQTKLLGETKETIDSLIVFDHDDSSLHELQGSIKNVIVVKPGLEFRKLDDKVYEINPERDIDYKNLFTELVKDGIKLNVLHQWNYKNQQIDTELDYEQLLQKGIYSLFNISKACMELKLKERMKLLFLYEESEGISRCFNVASKGLMSTLTFENPRYEYHLIGVDESSEKKVGRFSIARSEFEGIGKEEIEIRYKEGIRQGKEIVDMETREHGLGLKDGGVYVITGGTGGLGFIFSTFLAEKYKAKLVLTGRSELTPEKQEQIKRISLLGGEAIYIPSDVTRLDDMKQVIKETKDKFGAIHGVLHTAGIVQDSAIINKDVESFSKVITSKVYGTVNLDEATKDENLDFFMMFSSISSILGSPGQSDYASGNCFMDEFARYREMLARQNKRFGKSIAINWPLWKEGGMRPLPSAEELMARATGMRPLDTEKGLQAFVLCSGLDENQVIIIEGDQRKIRETLKVKEIDLNHSTKSSIATFEKMEAGKSEAHHIIENLVEELSTLLGMNAEEIDLNEDIEEYGADSIVVMELINHVNNQYGIHLMPVEIFDYPSINLMSEYISRLIGEKVVHNTYNDLENNLINELSILLGMNPEELDLHVDIEEYGADSIVVMELINNINSKYGINLMPVEIFDYPTIKELADYILSLLGEPSKEESKPADETPNHELILKESVTILDGFSHPFIDRVEKSTNSVLTAKKSFMLENDPMFYDHIVLGLPRLQAVGYLEMIYAASKYDPAYSVNHISDVLLYYPISILESISNDSETIFTQGKDGSFDVEINSFFNGKIYKNTKAKARNIELAKKVVDINSLKEKFTDEKMVGFFEEVLGQDNNFVGPYFYAYKEVYGVNNQYFGHLDLSDKAKGMNLSFFLHPGLLDPCVYMAMAIAHDQFNNLGNFVYLPIFFKEIKIHDHVKTECYCLVEYDATELEDRKVLRFNITCFDLNGKVLIEILGLDLKKVNENNRSATQKILENMDNGEQYKLNKEDILKKW